jgi:hypothetical protein
LHGLWVVPLFIIGAGLGVCAVRKDSMQQTDALVFLVILAGVIVRAVQILTIFDLIDLTGVDPIKGAIELFTKMFVLDMQLLRVACTLGTSASASYSAQTMAWPFACCFVLLLVGFARSCAPRIESCVDRWCHPRLQKAFSRSLSTQSTLSAETDAMKTESEVIKSKWTVANTVGKSVQWATEGSYARRMSVAHKAITDLGVNLINARKASQLSYLAEVTYAIGLLGLVCFITVTMWAVVPFVCYDHPMRLDGRVEKSVMKYPETKCDFQNREHIYLLIFGTIGMALGPIFLFALCSNATRLYPSKVAVGDAIFIRTYGFMFTRFYPRRYYFGMVQLIHNVLLSLTPVIIRSDIIGQILFMGIVLLSLTLCHAYFHPFRIKGGDEMYMLVFSGLLLLILINTTVISEKIDMNTVKIVSAGVAGVVVIALLCILLYAVSSALITRPWYAYFVCHCKRSAGSLSRLLQIKFQQHTKRPYPTFIDSDHLVNLDRLFATVRAHIGHLVVVLDSHVLSRPWCAGEITTAMRNHVTIIVIRTTSFTKDENVWKKENFIVEAFFNYEESGLSAYGIERAAILDSYVGLLEIKKIRMPMLLRDKPLDQVVGMVLKASKGLATSSSPCRPGCKRPEGTSTYQGDVVTVLDYLDYEACCAVMILYQKIFTLVRGVFLAWPYEEEGTSYETYRDKIYSVFDDTAEGSRVAVLLMLSPRYLQAPAALEMSIMAYMESKRNRADLVPVLLPFFDFPDRRYYEIDLPALFGNSVVLDDGESAAQSNMESLHSVISFLPRAAAKDLSSISEKPVDEKMSGRSSCRMSSARRNSQNSRGSSTSRDTVATLEEAEKALKAMFKIICVNFNVQGGDHQMTSQAEGVVIRLRTNYETGSSVVVDEATMKRNSVCSKNTHWSDATGKDSEDSGSDDGARISDIRASPKNADSLKKRADSVDQLTPLKQFCLRMNDADQEDLEDISSVVAPLRSMDFDPSDLDISGKRLLLTL